MVVVEKAFAVGAGGIVGQNVRLALRRPAAWTVYDVVAGLGGRPVTRASLRGLLDDVLAGRLEPQRCTSSTSTTTWSSASWRGAGAAAAGPHAENMLRDLGTVGVRRPTS